MSKTASIAEGACTVVMPDMHGDSGEFMITVNGEPVASNTTTNNNNNNKEFLGVVRGSSILSDVVLAPPSGDE